MLAIDQRGSLRRMIAAHTGTQSHAVPAKDLRRIKQIVTEAMAPLASAVLTDPIYGYPSSFGFLAPESGVLLSAEVTGYELVGDHERRSRLIDGWLAEDALRIGADGVKLLIWHHPEASPATQLHQQEIVQTVGEQCAAVDLPFVLEVVTYASRPEEKGSKAFAARKPELVLHGARTYSAEEFQVDMLKIEFPADLKFTEEYQCHAFASGEAVYGLSEVRQACEVLDKAAAVPWVILSAGVDPDEFVQNIALANDAGASGFLCGRAAWKRVVAFFPDQRRMRDYAFGRGRSQFLRIRDANVDALPWHEHRHFVRRFDARALEKGVVSR